jgi:hypothetical protein
MAIEKLNPVEAQTALWLKLKGRAEQRLQALRAKNDGNLDVEATAKVRGQIAELKIFLELDKPTTVLALDAGDEPPSDIW